jgi:adenylate cyclase
MALIDEKSLDAEGRWPWPRSQIARLVDVLSRDGARVIAFDVGFLEPEENPSLAFFDEVESEVERLGIGAESITAFLSEQRRSVHHDALLADAISRSEATVILGYFFHIFDEDGRSQIDLEIPDSEIDARYDQIIESAYPLIQYAKPIQTEFWPEAYAPETNLPMLSDVAAASGYFSLKPDGDGVVRWMPLAIGFALEAFPPLSVLAAWHHLGQPKMVLRVGEFGIEGLQIGERLVPTDEKGRLLINYRGDALTFPHVSVGDILAGEVPSGTFRDRIVLVGATATGTYDMRSTPFNPVYPGVEIHANAIDNMITGDFISKPAWTAVYDAIAIAILAVLVGLSLPRVGALAGLVITFSLFAVHIGVARELFVRWGVWLNIVYPLLSCVTTYTVLTVFYYVTEERERKKIRWSWAVKSASRRCCSATSRVSHPTRNASTHGR